MGKRKHIGLVLMIGLIVFSITACGEGKIESPEQGNQDTVVESSDKEDNTLDNSTKEENYLDRLGVSLIQGNTGTCISVYDYNIWRRVKDIPTDGSDYEVYKEDYGNVVFAKTSEMGNEIPIVIEVETNEVYEKDDYVEYIVNVYFDTPHNQGVSWGGVCAFDMYTGFYFGGGTPNQYDVMENKDDYRLDYFHTDGYNTDINYNGQIYDIYYRELIRCSGFEYDNEEFYPEGHTQIQLVCPKSYNGCAFYIYYDQKMLLPELNGYRILDELPIFHKDKGLFIKVDLNKEKK